ncbi:MAG TPA: hypothetical protein PKN45_07560 [Candidatus Limiplasma sp.]|jgi:hypothetical protein|nr:hypothetical protein [Candidatus Limiplasma sp.]
MERFLRYSLEKGRAIRAVLLLNGQMEQKTVTVLALDTQTATLRIGAKKTPVPVALTDILGCDYARGDHGEE